MRLKWLEESLDDTRDAVLEAALALPRPVPVALAALADAVDDWLRASEAVSLVREAEYALDDATTDAEVEAAKARVSFADAESDRLDAERERIAEERVRASLRVGDRVTVRAPEGGTYEDVIRDLFEQEILLEPHGRNERAPAAVLTVRSWCLLSDVVGRR